MKEKFVQAAKAENVNAAIETFKDTFYAPILNVGLTRYRETGLTRFFDFSLDRTYYDELLISAESLPKKEREIALLVAGPKVDAFNIMVALRSKILNFPSHLTFWAITHRFHKLSEREVREMVLSDSVSSTLDHVKKVSMEGFWPLAGVLRKIAEEEVEKINERVNRLEIEAEEVGKKIEEKLNNNKKHSKQSEIK